MDQPVPDVPRKKIFFFALPSIMPPDLPRYTVDQLLRWQYEVLELMDTNSSIPASPPAVQLGTEVRDNSLPLPDRYVGGLYHRRIVNVVCDFKGHAGKMSFFKALKYDQPLRSIIVDGIPSVQGLLEIIEQARSTGWMGDAIIINTRYQETHAALDPLINGLISVARTTECNNLWIFTNIVPKITELAPVYWRFYKIWADWPKKIMSFLNPMTYQEAATERERQEKYISEHKILPRSQC